PGHGHGREPAAAQQPPDAPRAIARVLRRGRGPVAAARLNAAPTSAARSWRVAPLQLAGSPFFPGVWVLGTVVYAIGFVIACAFLPFPRRFVLVRGYAASVLWVLKWSCGLDYQVEGSLPPGCHVAFWKHSSSWETMAMMVVFPRQVWVLKRELVWI